MLKGALVIDDEPIIITALERILRPKGVKTFSASLGAEGLALYADHKDEIDLIFLDIDLPDILGSDILQKIREVNQNVLIYVISGLDINFVKDLVGKLTVDGYVSKPFSMPYLRKLVASLLGKMVYIPF